MASFRAISSFILLYISIFFFFCSSFCPWFFFFFRYFLTKVLSSSCPPPPFLYSWKSTWKRHTRREKRNAQNNQHFYVRPDRPFPPFLSNMCFQDFFLAWGVSLSSCLVHLCSRPALKTYHYFFLVIFRACFKCKNMPLNRENKYWKKVGRDIRTVTSSWG